MKKLYEVELNSKGSPNFSTAVEVSERKTGKWIKEDQYIDTWGDTIEVLRCSVCEFKHGYASGYTSKSDDGWFKFCPNCGRSMNGGDANV